MERQDKYNQELVKVPPSGIRRFFDLVIGNDDIISLGVGEPDFVTPWNIRENVFFHLEKGDTSYTSNWGLAEFREAVAKYMAERFKLTYSPEDEILATVGVSEGIDIALRSICNPGDEVILPEPAYVCYKPLITMAGGKCISLDTSKSACVPKAKDIEKLITKKTKALILSYPNNPTGATIRKEELKKIAVLVKKHKLWVLSDEIYAELTYEGTHTSFATLPGMREQTITFNGFSKAFAMTGWRIGYICAPKELMAMIVKIHQYSALCAPIMSQHAAIEAIRNSMKDVAEMKRSYQQRRNLMIKGFRDCGLDVIEPEGAFYMFPSIKKTGLTSEQFALKLLKKENVAVVPGDVFGAGGEGYIRCCYATDLNSIKEAINRICRFVKSIKKT